MLCLNITKFQCIHRFTYILTHTHTHTHIYINIYICVCACIYIYIYIYIYTYIHSLIHTCIYTYIYKYIYTHYLCKSMYMYLYTDIITLQAVYRSMVYCIPSEPLYIFVLCSEWSLHGTIFHHKLVSLNYWKNHAPLWGREIACMITFWIEDYKTGINNGRKTKNMSGYSPNRDYQVNNVV